MRYQLAWPAIKALLNWVTAGGRGNTVSAAPMTATQLVIIIIIIIRIRQME